MVCLQYETIQCVGENECSSIRWRDDVFKRGDAIFLEPNSFSFGIKPAKATKLKSAKNQVSGEMSSINQAYNSISRIFTFDRLIFSSPCYLLYGRRMLKSIVSCTAVQIM